MDSGRLNTAIVRLVYQTRCCACTVRPGLGAAVAPDLPAGFLRLSPLLARSVYPAQTLKTAS
eukprot:1065323-Pleurochrysis_carterae.AAC.2